MGAAARRRNKAKPTKPRPVDRRPEDAKIAHLVGLPMYRPGQFEAVDISNFSEGDVRKTLRSGERRTIRRKPKLDTLAMRRMLNPRQIKACEWYAEAHSLRYDTTGITAKWGGAGGSRSTNFDHLPKTRAQEVALAHFNLAREAISPPLLGLFEGVVLHGRPVGSNALAFLVAVAQLVARIEGLVEL